MNETKPNPFLRVMPSLTDVAFLLPLILLFGGLLGVRNMLGDGDTGWHIRIGDWILAHRQVPQQDMFSFTKPGQPFFAWEWLWDVGAASLHQHWGMGAVVLASLLVISFTSALLYRLVAIVDAYRVATYINAHAASGDGRLGPARLPMNPLSIAGLIAIVLVMTGTHVAVARYDMLAMDLFEGGCIFIGDEQGGPGCCGRCRSS